MIPGQLYATLDANGRVIDYLLKTALDEDHRLDEQTFIDIFSGKLIKLESSNTLLPITWQEVMW